MLSFLTCAHIHYLIIMYEQYTEKGSSNGSYETEFSLNPTALRTAEIQQSYCQSECNRVKLSYSVSY